MSFSAKYLVPHIRSLGEKLSCAEIGVCRGENIFHLLRECSNIEHFYGIDPWRAYKAGKSEVGQNTCNSWFDRAREILADHINDGRVELIGVFSIEASRKFPDAAFDFIFIDGDHSKAAVTADLWAWWSKVKPGGLFAGHDFRLKDIEVRAAVYEFVAAIGQKVTPVGVDEYIPEPCWLIQKETL